jgi:CRP-like cAMP-binding protein
MKQYINLLKNTYMFNGINESEIEGMLKCLNARTMLYKKNEYILRNGETVNSIGMVLEGLALVEKEDIWGNRTIISEISPGSLYAESYACLSKLPAEISVIASDNTTVMLFDIRRILTTCSSSCGFHTKLIQNLLYTIAQKNVLLTKKMEYISKKTIKEKLLAYLSSEAMKAGSPTFNIPFNRQELADFLSVDRSALSSEISRLQKKGIISCRKNAFTILMPDS